MYRLGLDIGTTSVGWAVLHTDENAEPDRIIDLGVRIFDAAEDPQDGSSLARPRRRARGMRRTLRRRRHRIHRIKALMVSDGIITDKECGYLFPDGLEVKREKGVIPPDIYKIRAQALDRLLTNTEFARLMVHLAQRRGFRSNRKNTKAEGDDGKLLKAAKANDEKLKEGKYRTVGEMLYKDEAYRETKRNKGGEYSNTFFRRQIEHEVDLIFTAQKIYGSPYVTDEFCEKYKEILFSQRDFDKGPGGDSPYGGDMIEKMVGDCTFEKGEKRAAKATYTFEYFNLLTKVNAISIVNSGTKRKLTDSERKKVIELCHKKANMDYSVLRKELGLADEEYFGNISYRAESGKKEEDPVLRTEKKTKFMFLKNYHTMRKAFDTLGKNYLDSYISVPKRDMIGTALSYYKTDDRIKEYLGDNFTSREVEVILGLDNFSKFGNLSVKAMQKIIPFLEKGETYDKACRDAGYDFRRQDGNTRSRYLPPLPDDSYEVTSPVAKRAINQSIRVINAIVKKYGPPAVVNVELAREMSKTKRERDEIKRAQDKNAALNEKVVAEIRENFNIQSPRGQDIIKYRLWKDQDGICLYTNNPIKCDRLFENGYCEIDHIIPYSISFDDRYSNKVLVLTKANREKGNRVPMEYVESKADFIGLVNTLVRDRRKRENLLTPVTPYGDEEMKERSLQDTKHVAVFVADHIRKHLEFDPGYGGKQKVITVNGAITSKMRARWGINKIRENGDLHHAVDAVVIACITQGMVKRITDYSKYHETERDYDRHGEKEKFPLPWPEFRREVDIRTLKSPGDLLIEADLPNYRNVDITRIEPPFVSRMERKKSTGQGHKETIRSRRVVDGETVAVVKTGIQSLKLDKNGEIAGYYNPTSDSLLYRELKKRLTRAGGDGKKAFPEGYILKPSPKGGNRPKVKKVKTYGKTTLNVEVNGGIADNGTMVRIDLYKVKGEGYYFVPVYASDLVGHKRLPSKACIQARPYDQWKEMDEKDFLYSIYPNDLLYIKRKKDIKFNRTFEEANIPENRFVKEAFVYFSSADIAGATIKCIFDDNSYFIRGLGVKTMDIIEKYHVDVLGNRYKAEKEKRRR